MLRSLNHLDQFQVVPIVSEKELSWKKNLLWWLWGCAGSMMSGSLDAGVRWSWSIFKNEKFWHSEIYFLNLQWVQWSWRYVGIAYRSVSLSEGNEYCLFQNQNYLHRWSTSWKQVWPRFLLFFFLKPISWFEKIEMFFKPKAT